MVAKLSLAGKCVPKCNLGTRGKMSENIKIRIPYIFDDPIVGRTMSPIQIPLRTFNDYLIIENEILRYKGSVASSRAIKSFNLKNIAKILLQKREFPCLTKEHHYDFWTGGRIEIELSLVDIEGERHILIPKFFIDRGQKALNRFLSELCKYSSLPLEEEAILL
jgi:hypothetical protein